MNIVQTIILGVIQGLTEFLPISSSGHLIIAGRMLGISYMPLSFELVAHMGTLLAIVITMRKTVWGLVKKPLQKTNALLIVATVPTILIFLVFRNVFEVAFDGRWLALCFVITAAVLLISSMVHYKKPKTEFSFLDAAIIGIAQGATGFPGISRSGTTIASGKLLGAEQKTAANFSFLLAIPLIMGATVWQIATTGLSLDALPIAALIAGFIASFISGLFAVKFMLKLLQKFSLNAFSIYLILLAAFMLLNDFIFMLF